MKIVDPAKYPELRKEFPELTQVQFETSFLFAQGIPQKEISVLRAVSYKNVKQTIAESKNKFETKSLTGLLTVFHVRLSIFTMYYCKRIDRTTPTTN
ncbi:helix-turn-helix transcriptional regulator [Arsenophonus nasoniae]|uniref:Transcriptional regulator n=1 Tax=Arsenophonus nasoniae TaxID=638 RepID=A0AA95K4G9_9GAMM|nr:transcriptional regulator [Arsenophonus nasoniae]WGL95865.1 transcriptional regulator [Arsenophonus nasoniae]